MTTTALRSTTGIVHLRVNGRAACNTGTRWPSRVMTTTTKPYSVTCKSCRRIGERRAREAFKRLAAEVAAPCLDCEHNDPRCPDCPNPPFER